jgi:hypothetical protein
MKQIFWTSYKNINLKETYTYYHDWFAASVNQI